MIIISHCYLLLLLLLLIGFCFFTTSTMAINIAPGSSLYASRPNLTTWSSPNAIFSLGFTHVGLTSFIVSISYIGGITIWAAGGGGGAIVDPGGAFHFLSDGNLRLVNGSGSTLWSSNTQNLGVTSASIDNSGEFKLLKGTFSVWSSFHDPTDTIVASQNLSVNQILRSGVYSFRLLPSGNLTLTWNNSVMYWNQNFNFKISNLTSPILELQNNGILSLSDPSLRRPAIMAYGNDYGEGGNEILRFLRLDKDGNLRMYSSNRGGTDGDAITMTWAAIADQCQVYGYCGNLGICSYNDDSNTICGCPSENFEKIDVNDSTKGCKRKVELEDCEGNVTMLELERTKFLTYQAEQIVIVGITACRLNCLSSSSCVGSSSLSDGTGLCYMKTPDFVSGYKIPMLLSTSYVKVCGPAQLNPSPSMDNGESKCRRSSVWVIITIILGTLLGLIAFVGGFWWCFYRKITKFGPEYTFLEYASGAPVQFSYKELHRSTEGFKEKIGEGGFGTVYRGVIADRTIVAVKQLEGIEQGEKQFRMEVATISSTHHLNLVRLIGFCSEGRHRLLVYEFMKNGSLNNFLFISEDQPGKLLNWEYRFRIAIETAKGIAYLHEECRDCIVHCDIKPENILLDENHNAKVSDFGLAKLIKDDKYKSLMSIGGTRGYLAPEWLANLAITSKADVYSYGMVLLELVSGRRNFEVSAETNQKRFSTWAYVEFEKDNLEAIFDKRLKDQSFNMEEVKRAVQVSFWCIQENPSLRPKMGRVVQMLDGIVEILRPPAPKAVAKESVGGRSKNVTNTEALSLCSSIETPRKNMERASSALLESFQIESHSLTTNDM